MINSFSAKFKLFSSLVGLVLFLIACSVDSVNIQVVNPKCENRIDPLGIEILNPHLGWELRSSFRNKKQSAYQILVADSKQALADSVGNLWDTKKVNSNQSIQVKYKGKPLSSGMVCYWKVRVWDEAGKVSPWSEVATWEMGLLEAEDWKAKWISDGKPEPQTIKEFYEDDPAPLFRYEFNSDKKIINARLYITGLGYYETSINGKKVGDHVLDPGWTNYSKRVLYSTYDVTGLIEDGGNCIGVILGNGWFNPLPMTMWGKYNLRDALPHGRPQFIAQLKIKYADGTSQIITSNEKWKTHGGPILRNNIYLGEVYDARKEINGWSTFGFDDSNWNNAKTVKSNPGKLQAQNQPPIRITGKLKSVKLTEPKPNVWIFDMGQNYAGWVKIKVQAPEGTKVTLRYGELLNQDGTLNVMTSVAGQIKGRKGDGSLIGGPFAPDTAWQSDIYITKGKGIEYYTPKFTFHGFRYVEVTGYPGKPSLDAIEGLRLSSDLPKTGSFECSNDLFNEIQKMTEWTFLSNVFSVQSDCPHRERFGYGGDLAVTTDAYIYNFDMSKFYPKVVRDFAEAAHPNGMLTDTAPFVGIEFCGIGWALAHPLTLLELYQYYGNVSLIEEQYNVARRWFETVISENDLIITHGLSDHESLAPIPTSEMVTPLYYQSAVIMSKLAAIIGRTDDAEKYRKLSEQIKKAYLEKYHDKGSGRFAPYTQASQAFAIYTGIVPKNEIRKAIDELVNNIDEHQEHLTTGIFGTKYMLDVLSEYGHAETAARVVNQKSFPSWGYMIENGATTLWEHWEFSNNTYSHNHPMFGSVSEWFYKWVAGIQLDSSAVGFDKIVIRPQMISEVNWVKAHHNSIHGKIVSEWEKNNDIFTLNITIPVNTTAKVYLPTVDITSIKESGTNISDVRDIQLLNSSDGYSVFKIGSGNYYFESKIILKKK